MKQIIFLAILLTVLCGCVAERSGLDSIPSSESDIIVTECETEADIPSAAAPFDEIPSETPEITESPTVAVPILNIPSGTYSGVFSDSELNERLDYFYFVPENAVEGLPLIVFLHGDGNVGLPQSMETSGFIRFAKDIYGESFPFIVLQPCTSRYSWIDGNLPQALIGLTDKIANECAVDRNRIIITGHSRGAIGTWALITFYGNYFSAAVPVSCGNQTAMDYDVCSQVPVWAFAGNIGQDELGYHGIMRYFVDTIEAHGGTATMTTLAGYSHGLTPEGAYTKETIEWMLAQ